MSYSHRRDLLELFVVLLEIIFMMADKSTEPYVVMAIFNIDMWQEGDLNWTVMFQNLWDHLVSS